MEPHNNTYKRKYDEVRKQQEEKRLEQYNRFYSSPSGDLKIVLQEMVAGATRRIASDPKDALAYRDLGYALSELGDQDAAEDEFDRSISLSLNAEAFNGRGLERLRKGYLDEAFSDFMLAVRLGGTGSYGAYQDNLDVVTRIKDSNEELIEYLRGALKDRPTDLELQFRLGSAYAEQGEVFHARQYLMQVIQGTPYGSGLQRRARLTLSTLGGGM